jgi:hypothetical protein
MANRNVILSLSKDPLTSILSLGGERKIKDLTFIGGKRGILIGRKSEKRSFQCSAIKTSGIT